MPNNQENGSNYVNLVIEMADKATDFNDFQKLARNNLINILIDKKVVVPSDVDNSGDATNEPHACSCPESLDEHLEKIVSYHDFALHVYRLARLSKKYPELVSSWLNSFCFNLSREDWAERELQRLDIG